MYRCDGEHDLSLYTRRREPARGADSSRDPRVRMFDLDRPCDGLRLRSRGGLDRPFPLLERVLVSVGRFAVCHGACDVLRWLLSRGAHVLSSPLETKGAPCVYSVSSGTSRARSASDANCPITSPSWLRTSLGHARPSRSREEKPVMTTHHKAYSGCGTMTWVCPWNTSSVLPAKVLFTFQICMLCMRFFCFRSRAS